MKLWKLAAATAALAMVGSGAMAETPKQMEANKKVAVDFYLKGLQSRNMPEALKYLDDSYLQHNPNVPTGKIGFRDSFGPRWAAMPANAPAPINPPVLVMAENDLVTLVFKRVTPEPGKPGQTYDAFWFDTFRLKNNLIVEHWDPATKPPVPAAAPAAAR